MAWICGQPPLTILSIGSVTIHSASGLELGGELLDGPREACVLEGAALDLADGVHDGGVVAAVEGFGDRWKREVGELAGQIHGELASSGNGGAAGGGEDVVYAQAESSGHRFLDLTGVGALGRGREDLLGGQGELHGGGRDGRRRQRGVGDDAGERSLQDAEVGGG